MKRVAARPRRRAGLALALGWALGLASAGTGGLAQQPALRVYSVRDGLRFPQVFALLQDRQGFLWVGTSYGVARYDGRAFSTLTRADGLPHDSVIGLAEDGQGAIQVLTQEGLAEVDALGARGEPRVRPGRVRLGQGARLVAAAGGSVWLAGRRGVWLQRGGDSSALALGPAAGESPVWLGDASEDEAWICTPRHVLRLHRQGPATAWPVPRGLGPAVALAHLSGVTLLVQRGGISRLEGGTFVPDPRWRLPAGCEPSGALVHAGALVVLDSPRGALRLGPGPEPRRLSVPEGLPSGTVNAALEDRDGLLWLGTEDGLVKVFDLATESWPSRRPLLGPMVLSFARDRAGTLWVGHSEGLARLVAGRLEAAAPDGDAGALSTGVWDVLALSDGSVLAATRRGLVLVSGGRARRFPDLPLAGSGRVFSLHASRDGSLWAGTLDGAVRFRLQRGVLREAAPFTTSDGAAFGEARGFSEEPDGTLWVGTDGAGLVRLGLGGPRRFGVETGLPSGVCRSVLARPDGLLVGTDAGLFRVRDGQAQPLAAVNAALGWPYVVALAASGETTFVATAERVALVRDGQVIDLLDDARGLVGRSTTAERCLLAEGRSRLWVGMLGGFSVVDLQAPRARAPRPRVLLTFALDGAGQPVTAGMRLPHARNGLSFSFRSPTFLAEERTRFQWRLAGHDPGWSAPTAVDEQRYTNLPAGEYQLEVRALSASGRTSAEPARLSFSVAPPWWETVPARGAAAAAVVGLAWLLTAWRTRQLRQRTSQLEQRVLERTREIGETNRRLRQAQDRIARLLETAGQAQEDLDAWTGRTAGEIARASGASALVFVRLDPATHAVVAAPPDLTLDQRELRTALRDGASLRPGRTLLRVDGPAGEEFGVLVVDGPLAGWGEPEMQLFRSFAHQLGGALEMRRVRGRLATAEAARQAVRLRLEEQGIATAAVCPTCRRCFEEANEACPRDGARLLAQRVLPFRIAGRYRLARVLGEGGMGTVFLAHDEALARDVALKLVRPERFDDPAVRVRFEREARALAHVDHPGVLAIHDSGSLDDGSAFLVTERLVGWDLAAVLRHHGRARLDQAAELVRQSGAALAAAHRAGLVHRDVKPENVFLARAPDDTFRVKVVDFGLAKPLGADTGLTEAGTLLGTPAYMSPEQVSGREVGPASDLYSLGLVAWEVLAGARAVTASSLGEIFASILSGQLPPASASRPGLPPAVDAVLGEALHKDPRVRAADVEVWALRLAAALQGLVDDEPGWPPGFLVAAEDEATEESGSDVQAQHTAGLRSAE